MINWTEANPLAALMGGILIGGAASILLLLNGRIAGISGIAGGLFNPNKHDIAWRLAFLLGLAISPVLYGAIHPLPTVTVHAGNMTLIAAGLLVGIGTRYASGCTSGHGICGLARLSPRSIAATFAFMLAGAFTVFLVRQFTQ